jgi:hypothetical protein
MKLFNISLIALGSTSLLFLGACNSDRPAAKIEVSTPNLNSEVASKTENIASKDDKKHTEGDGHDHTNKDKKDGHDGQVVQSGKYHVEFKSHLEKDSTHLDIKLHGEQDKEITDAKLTAQVQLPGGSSQTLAVPYSAEEKQYVAKLLTTAKGDYQVVLQADVKGDKFNSRFSFKR